MLALAVALEDGRFDGPVARLCARAWSRVASRTVARPLRLPPHVRVLAIGGATLGGSGKTPLAIACAEELAAGGARVTLVGHAYRARPGQARIVGSDDPLDEVGDEALVAARALARSGVRVVVAPRRAEAIAFAARDADVLVLDGVAQATPARAALALLAVDAVAPWGQTGALAPCGDLRAPKEALLRASDAVVSIGEAPSRLAPIEIGDDGAGHVAPKPWFCATVKSSGARFGETFVPWHDLSGAKIGLLCALARPERIVRSLAMHRLAPTCVLRAPDHGPPTAALLAHAARARAGRGVDVWLSTPKCAVHFDPRGGGPDRLDRGDVGLLLHAPLGVIEHALLLPPALRHRLHGLAVP